MTEKQLTGNKGEQLAKNFLIKKGYKILKENYRYKHAEIDLIAKKGNELVFVEVKTRSYSDFGEPEIAVNKKKTYKIFSAANRFIHEIDWQKLVRFDVISIVLDKQKNEAEIVHFEDAFY